MELEVRLFAMLRDAVGSDRLTVAVAPGASGADLKQLIGRAHPELERLLPQCRWAAAQRFVPDNYQFQEAEEIALIPPVSGG